MPGKKGVIPRKIRKKIVAQGRPKGTKVELLAGRVLEAGRMIDYFGQLSSEEKKMEIKGLISTLSKKNNISKEKIIEAMVKIKMKEKG